jgi:hypothetical protein
MWLVQGWSNSIIVKRPGYVLVAGQPDDDGGWQIRYAPGETSDSWRTVPAGAERYFNITALSGDAPVRIPMYPPPGPPLSK